MKKLVFCVIVTALMLPGVVRAQEDIKGENSSLMLEELVVTAGRVEEKKKEITSNITVIDEAEIKISSAMNLGDLLAEKGIGTIKKYPGALTAIGIRGLRTETHGNDLMGRVLVLLNGHRAATGNLR